jgi:DHA1 family bicyclomycin/chloramphenicol resistance-like MFS transporter
VVQCVAVAGLFVYVGGSPFVLQEGLGLGPGRYAVVFATDAAAMAATSLVFRFTVARLGPSRLRTAGCLLSAGAATVLLGVAHRPALAVVWVLLALVLAGMGLSVPAATVLAQEAGARSAGTASSLLGGLGYLAAAVAAPLTGLIDARSLLDMAIFLAACFALALTAVKVSPIG